MEAKQLLKAIIPLIIEDTEGEMHRTNCLRHFFTGQHCSINFSVYIAGGLAQVVERSICIREAPGSIPGFSSVFSLFHHLISRGDCALHFRDS